MSTQLRRAVALAAAISLTLGACGGRAEDAPSAAPAPAEAPSDAAPADPGVAPDGAAVTGPDAAAAQVSPAGPGGGGGGSPAVPAGGNTTRSGAGSSAPSPSAATAAAPAAGKPSPDAPGGAAPGRSAPAPGEAPAAGLGPAPAPSPSGPKPEVLFGSIGTSSGPIGANVVSSPTGTKAWVADINARGGLAGHPVRVVFADDGGDPQRALAIARRMVEQDKVVAIFNFFGLTSLQGAIPYLEQKQVPILGAEGGNPAADHSRV
ncbi:MAG TPA: ABC transporter substrate-binding protein, partial [Acidimicrobiia bacterium]|nr:ABC transporter substrate-binding protein [Acidimicrobiia bacterium]